MTSDILLICRASDNTSSSRNLQLLKNVFQKLLEKSNSSLVLLARIKCNKDICIFLHGTTELHLWEAAPWWGSASMKLYQISQILKMTIGAPVPTITMQLWIKWSCPVLFFFFFYCRDSSQQLWYQHSPDRTGRGSISHLLFRDLLRQQ